MISIFGGKEKSGGGAPTENIQRTRHSSGWGQLLERLHSQAELRVLDIGTTSSININFVTSLGHSIYLANLVEEASKPEWIVPEKDGEEEHFDVERFLSTHLDFTGQAFDIVLFWDTADYLPEVLLEPVLERIHAIMAPGGQMLALFHSPTGTSSAGVEKTDFCRYHMTDTSKLEVQHAGDFPLLNHFSSRRIEKLLEAFQGHRSILGKDNVREVMVER
jgi:hypothetical protein